MALTCRTFRNFSYLKNITKPLQWNLERSYCIAILPTRINYETYYTRLASPEIKQIKPIYSLRKYSTQDDQKHKLVPEPEDKKPSIFQKFKQMYRDYWYVLLPVHMGTSLIWFGSFYYAVRSGVDVISLLKTIGISEAILSPLRDSSAGYFALALALYKLVTPLRYAVTVGATTFAIKKLTSIGWIRPVPSKARIKEMIQEKKDTLQDKFNESKQQYQVQMREKKSQIMEEVKRYKDEMRNMKNKPPKQQ